MSQLQIFQGTGINPDEPWTTDSNQSSHDTGTSESDLISISIPNDQVSLVEIEVAASGSDSDANYGGPWGQRLRVEKRVGQIINIDVLETEDLMEPNLQGHGHLFQLLFALTQEPADSESFTIGTRWISEHPLYPSPFYANQVNDTFAKLILDYIDREMTDWTYSLEKAGNQSRIKFQYQDPDVEVLSEMSILDSIRSSHTIETEGGTGLTVKSTNPKVFGISKETFELSETDPGRPVAFSQDSSGNNYLFYPNPNQSDRIEVQQDPPATAEVVSSDALDVSTGILQALSYNGVQHVFFQRNSDGYLIHADNAGGSWSQDVVDNTNVSVPHLDVVVDSSGTFHLLYAQNGGNAVHFSGTAGSWTVQNTFTNNSGPVGLAINGSDELGALSTDEGSTAIYFYKYSSGSWSGGEALSNSTGDTSSMDLVWSGSEWHIGAIPTFDQHEVGYWHGTSGSWTGKKTAYQTNVGAQLGGVAAVSNQNGNAQLIWTHDRLEVTQFFWTGDETVHMLDVELELAYAGFEASTQVDGRNLIGFSSNENVEGIVGLGRERTVTVDYDVETRVKHYG